MRNISLYHSQLLDRGDLVQKRRLNSCNNMYSLQTRLQADLRWHGQAENNRLYLNHQHSSIEREQSDRERGQGM